jgi:hypothetical protein
LNILTIRHLGYTISDQTVGNILRRHGSPPASERKKTTTWKAFIRTHMDMLVATDFFTTEVWTLGGLVTYYILFFIHLGSRRVHIAGITPHPHEAWMVQIARNVTMEEWGVLFPGQYLIHDRDGKFHTPPDLVVKSQAIDITEIILSRIRRPNAVPTQCRNRISRFEQLSTSETHWSTTKSDGMWAFSVKTRNFGR